MCLALLAKQGSRVSHRLMRRAWENNPDGAGLMYADGGRLHVQRFMNSENDVWRAYKALLDSDGRQAVDVVLHFRFATHGLCTEDNCHPFLVHSGLGLVHNGIIYIDQEKGDTRSDTRAFCEDYLAKLSPDFHLDPGTCSFLEGMKTLDGSKLILLDEQGRHRIINESLGFWQGGVWFSNRTGHERSAWGRHYWPRTDNLCRGSYRWMGHNWWREEDLPGEVPCSWCEILTEDIGEDMPLCTSCRELVGGAHG